MCHIFAGQDPQNYAFVTRSIRLSGLVTSVRLEQKFWEIVDHIASMQNMRTSQFLSAVYTEAQELQGDVVNFASLLRCACLLYLEKPQETLHAVVASQTISS